MVDDHAEAVTTWRKLHEQKGRRATVIDLYRIVAEPRGVRPQELPVQERLSLARAVMPIIWPGFELTEGSERVDLIEVVEYNHAWPRRFKSWRERIPGSLGAVARRIEHVGSTSVPGLAAKPIIDIQVSVVDLDDEDAYVPSLEAFGVQLRSRDSLHRYFRPSAGQPRDVHVHVCRVGSQWEAEHLLFRDYLRSHPDDAGRYAQAKLQAVKDWSDDGWAYTDAKTEAILDILDAAESWAAVQSWRPQGADRPVAR